MWSWSFPSQKKCKVSPQLTYFDGGLLDDEELWIVHQARLPHFPSTFNWRFCGLFHHQPSLAGNSECRWVRQESKCGDLQTADRRRSSSLSPVDAFKVKDQKPFTFFLVWWFKLILFPGIHQKGEVVSIENNSRENQSTPAVQHCKDVSYGEGI